MSSTNLPCCIEKNTHLDGRRSFNRQIGRERSGLAGLEVAGVEGDAPMVRGGDGLNLPVESRVLVGSGDLGARRGHTKHNRVKQTYRFCPTQERKHETG